MNSLAALQSPLIVVVTEWEIAQGSHTLLYIFESLGKSNNACSMLASLIWVSSYSPAG